MSPKEKVWLAEYLKTFNATEAARRADYNHPEVMGSRKKKKFAEEIDAAIQERVLEAEEVLSMLADIATFDPSPYVRKEGKLIWLDTNKMIEDGYGHLIREVYTTKDGPRVTIADQDWAKKVVLDHATKGPAGTKDDPLHVRHDVIRIIEHGKDESE